MPVHQIVLGVEVRVLSAGACVRGRVSCYPHPDSPRPGYNAIGNPERFGRAWKRWHAANVRVFEATGVVTAFLLDYDSRVVAQVTLDSPAYDADAQPTLEWQIMLDGASNPRLVEVLP